jgi:hypothetical protein
MKKAVFTFCLILIAASVRAEECVISNADSFATNQQADVLCWAACNQMLLLSQGITNVSQWDQLKKVFHTNEPTGAGPDFRKAKVGLAGIYKTESGKFVKITTRVNYRMVTVQPSPWLPPIQRPIAQDPTYDAGYWLNKRPSAPFSWIISSLRAGRPLVTTDGMHGYVICGAQWENSPAGEPVITSLYLIDPAYEIDPDNHPKFNWYDFTGSPAAYFIGFMGMDVSPLSDE